MNYRAKVDRPMPPPPPKSTTLLIPLVISQLSIWFYRGRTKFLVRQGCNYGQTMGICLLVGKPFTVLSLSLSLSL